MVVLSATEGAEVSPVVSMLCISGAVSRSANVEFDADFSSVWRREATVGDSRPDGLPIGKLDFVAWMMGNVA